MNATDFALSVDLTNCDREPIHVPGSIQPHGAMLVCDTAGDMVTHASANAAEFLGRPSDEILGASLKDLLGTAAAHDLRNAGAKAGSSHVAGAVLGLALPGTDRRVDATIHCHDGRLLVELEDSLSSGPEAHAALDLTQSLIRRISLQSDVEGIAATGAKLVRAMLNYDRVMVYRFLHNGAGRVIAESVNKDERFLGQHFPAADIPVQARGLYLLNWIRLIGDSSYVPVPLILASGQDGRQVDMSYAHLRSVSPIHCEYLRNMGVAASMSISIVVDGALWGLIACHHDTPRVVPMPLRIGAELFGQYFSLQIAVAERRAEFMAAGLARKKLDGIISEIRPDEPVDRTLRDRLEGLAALIPCDGAGLWIEGQWTSTGATPPPEDVHRLMEFLNRTAEGAVWDTHELRVHLEDGYGEAVAGMLAVPISSLARDYLVLFRSEEAHEIEWAGEPGKVTAGGPLGDRLTPRGSFEAWREDVRGRSRPWTEAERAVAEAIRTYLRDVVLRYNEATAEERDRAEQRRRVLNDELNHRVKNILSLVKSIASQTGVHASSVEEYSSALEGRLRALAFAHDQSLANGSGGDLGTLMEAEASLHRYGAPDRVVASGPPVGLTDRTFGALALVIHEMMTNAAKYGALSASSGKVAIDWSFNEDGDCLIEWRESGGPRVKPPSRTGFGSTLIRNTLTYDLGGEAEVTYPESGLVARFTVPQRHLAEIPQKRMEDQNGTSVSRPLDTMDVLLVEDQSLIAMDTEEILRRLGARKVRSCPDAARAKQEIAASMPNCAVLDFNLGDQTTVGVAEMLASAKVPFVFATGYGDTSMIPKSMSDIPVVAKPISSAALAEALSYILRSLHEETGAA